MRVRTASDECEVRSDEYGRARTARLSYSALSLPHFALPWRRGFALIELVVAILIIALLAAVGYGLWRHGKPGEKSIPKQAVEKAQGVDCQSMLQQVRASIQMATMDNEDKPPPSIPPDMQNYAKCPVSGQPYTYDPQTGTVKCTTPGHEAF